jgi:hypothetical protein
LRSASTKASSFFQLVIYLSPQLEGQSALAYQPRARVFQS